MPVGKNGLLPLPMPVGENGLQPLPLFLDKTQQIRGRDEWGRAEKEPKEQPGIELRDPGVNRERAGQDGTAKAGVRRRCALP